MSEGERLTAFLLALQTSPAQRQRFQREPKKEMRRFNLSSQTIEAVLRKDAKTLWRILVSTRRGVIHMQWVVGVEKASRRGKRKRA